MTALFRTRLEQHGSGNLGDAVDGVRRGKQQSSWRVSPVQPTIRVDK